MPPNEQTPNDPAQDEQVVRAAYDEVADLYAEHLPSTEAETPADLGMIAHFVSLLPGERTVLDAGCGAGRMMAHLVGLGCRVEGVDLSPAMISQARAHHPDSPSRVASITDLPHPDDSFDGVFSWYSTIHGDDPALAASLAEFVRVARPGGLVLVAFQSGHGMVDVAPAYRRFGREVVLSRRNRTPDEVAAAMAAAGLREVAQMERAAVTERESQAVLIARTVPR